MPTTLKMLSTNVSTNGVIDTEHSQHQHHQQHTTTSAASSQTPNNSIDVNGRGCNSIVANNSINGNMRRRSSLNFHHQLQLVNVGTGATIDDDTFSMGNGGAVHCRDTSPGGRFSPHPNDFFLHHHHQHHGKLSLSQPIDRYDDGLTCCLPPPSPAPNSDRYVLGLVAPTTATTATSTIGNSSSFDCNTQTAASQTQQTLSSSTSSSSLSTNSGVGTARQYITSSVTTKIQQQQQQQQQQRAISPSSRFRTERYRDLTSKSPLCDNTITNQQQQQMISDNTYAASTSSTAAVTTPVARYAAHYLAQHSGTNTPLVGSDTYSYLSSTVHTPVKRYVPTPPPPNELYADLSLTSSVASISSAGKSSKCNTNSNSCSNNSSILHMTPQRVNTMPYRYRVKCCSIGNDQSSSNSGIAISHQQQLEQRAIAVTDFYATSPRTRAAYTSSGNNGNSNKCSGSALACSNNNNSTAIVQATCNGGKSSPNPILLQEQQAVVSAANIKSKPTNLTYVGSSGGVGTILSGACSSASSSSVASSSASPVTVGGAGSGPGFNSSVLRNDVASRTPSIEYINSNVAAANNRNLANERVNSPVTAVESAATATNGGSISNNVTNTGVATCLHCNTVRRTTGVHQTTQTTGPISPIPLQQQVQQTPQCLNNIQNLQHQHQSSLTPSTSESHISPLSPGIYQQLPLLGQQVRAQQKRETAEEQHQTLYNQQQQYNAQQNVTQSPVPQNVSTQSNLTERTVNCSQQQQQQQLTNRLPLQQLSPLQPPAISHQQQFPTLQQQQRYSRKKRLNQYFRREIARFFGVDISSEAEEYSLWHGRQRRLALRRFGALKTGSELLHAELNNAYNDNSSRHNNRNVGLSIGGINNHQHYQQHATFERPDILPAQDAEDDELTSARIRAYGGSKTAQQRLFHHVDFQPGDHVERKASVATMLISSLTYIVDALSRRQSRYTRQWSRSFAPADVNNMHDSDNLTDICEGLTALQEEEVFFDTPPNAEQGKTANSNVLITTTTNSTNLSPTKAGNSMRGVTNSNAKIIEHQRQIYIGERVHGWRTSAISIGEPCLRTIQQQKGYTMQQQQQQSMHQQQINSTTTATRGNRITAQLLDGVLENSRRPVAQRIKLFTVNNLDDRTDHRPFFTYWINTVQILVLFLSIICYGIGPIGIGVEQRTGQVLVTSLSLQTVQHAEQRNVWVGPRSNDLVHMGAKFATCMRRDVKIMDVLLKTRRLERETACCIRNDDSGCVQSSQADCSVRGLFPTSISTWKKWSPGESGPGGRISGSVCGLDPKYCDAPASIAPYEWPDDITKWPICRKTNSFSQRFRYKDHTAEHMICEVIGHPCCTGVYGECHITTREYCDFVKGYFHEEASLCSQISCLNNICGMFPFFSIEVPDQFYRLFTSLCLHAGILHLAITVAFQHIFLADLERLIGPIRTAIVYIGSGLAGNLASAVLVPYKAEVGPLASLSGVLASLVVLLILMQWKQLRKPHVALFKFIFIGFLLFGIGTLPWQLNFAGLLAGIFCGIFLTVALVPFVSFSEYGRKAKINLIWSCVIFHLFIYALMLVIFYAFPNELTNLNFGKMLSNNFGPSTTTTTNNNGNMGVNLVDDNAMSSTHTRLPSNTQQQPPSHFKQQQQQYHYRHYTEGAAVIANIGNDNNNEDAANDEDDNNENDAIDSKLAHLLNSQQIATSHYQRSNGGGNSGLLTTANAQIQTSYNNINKNNNNLLHFNKTLKKTNNDTSSSTTNHYKTNNSARRQILINSKNNNNITNNKYTKNDSYNNYSANINNYFIYNYKKNHLKNITKINYNYNNNNNQQQLHQQLHHVEYLQQQQQEQQQTQTHHNKNNGNEIAFGKHTLVKCKSNGSGINYSKTLQKAVAATASATTTTQTITSKVAVNEFLTTANVMATIKTTATSYAEKTATQPLLTSNQYINYRTLFLSAATAVVVKS